MNRRRWTYVGISAISVAGLSALGVDGLAGANSQSNDTGGTTGLVGAPAAAPATGTQDLTISAAAFAPDGLHTTTSDYFNGWDPATLSNADSGRCFNAGVYLPAGAKVSSVTFDYTEGTTSMSAQLNRQDLANNTYVLLASFDSPTSTTPVYTSTTISVTAHKSIVASDGYGLGVCPSGNTTFSGVTIAYTG